MATSMTLDSIADSGSTAISGTESALYDLQSKLGANSTAEDLLVFQAALAKNSTVVTVYSALLKERADTIKSCAQKFG